MTRRGWIIIGSAALIVLLAAAGVVWWLQRGGDISQVPLLNQLPGAQEQPAGEGQLPGASGVPSEIPIEGTSAPVSVFTPPPGVTPLPDARSSLAIRITYQQQPNFQASLTRVARTFEVPTIDKHEPQAGEPYSVLKILGANNQVLSQHSLTLPSVILFEDFSTGILTQNPERTLSRNELDVVVPLPAGGQAVGIRLETAGGAILDEEQFQLPQLPVDVAEPAGTSFLPSLLEKLRGETVHAQQSGTGVFQIVVTDQRNVAARKAVLAETKDMLQQVEPWKTYYEQGQIKVVEAPSGVNVGADLGCGTVPVDGNRFLPGCPNTGIVYRYVQSQGVKFNAIVVAIDVPSCPICGATRYGSRLSGVGAGATAKLVAHELGHALPAMYDEYLGERPFFLHGPARGPNCFSSEASCQQALTSLGDRQGGACTAACNSVESFRTSRDGLMRSGGSSSYTPYPACLMSHYISEDAGVQEAGFCGNQPPGNQPQETFWGWFKGG